MNYSAADIEKLGPEILKILGFRKERFNPNKFAEFLGKNFPENTAKDLQQKITQDLLFFRSHDPASAYLYVGKILSIRRGMMAIAIHRFFQYFLSSFSDEEKSSEKYRHILFELEYIAREVQSFTNIEIHPEANITGPMAIDHGHGTVIGATTTLGKNNFLYHGITLGATGLVNNLGQRHPQLGNNIFLGNGCQVLGPSILGDGCEIASEAMVINSNLGNGVKISPSVLVSGVKIPDNMQVLDYLAKDQSYITRDMKGNKGIIIRKFEIAML